MKSDTLSQHISCLCHTVSKSFFFFLWLNVSNLNINLKCQQQKKDSNDYNGNYTRNNQKTIELFQSMLKNPNKWEWLALVKENATLPLSETNFTWAARRVLTRSSGYVAEAAVTPAEPPATKRTQRSVPMLSLWFSSPGIIFSNCIALNTA